MFFWFLLSETNDYDDTEVTVGSFNKTREKVEKKKRNPIILFFRFLGMKIKEIFSYPKNKGETINEALVYPEDEIKTDNR